MLGKQRVIVLNEVNKEHTDDGKEHRWRHAADDIDEFAEAKGNGKTGKDGNDRRTNIDWHAVLLLQCCGTAGNHNAVRKIAEKYREPVKELSKEGSIVKDECLLPARCIVVTPRESKAIVCDDKDDRDDDSRTKDHIAVRCVILKDFLSRCHTCPDHKAEIGSSKDTDTLPRGQFDQSFQSFQNGFL